ncbi:unnamed protein product [Blepharisma stoltei]|uniref:Uncharacterized protein n=1 Tax=Blepharisma stoltei TaxID=1481888 RepID=A0AAU9JL45_9CILI|nr:unnamed protein product [Blepharisma stoltei]
MILLSAFRWSFCAKISALFSYWIIGITGTFDKAAKITWASGADLVLVVTVVVTSSTSSNSTGSFVHLSKAL